MGGVSLQMGGLPLQAEGLPHLMRWFPQRTDTGELRLWTGQLQDLQSGVE